MTQVRGTTTQSTNTLTTDTNTHTSWKRRLAKCIQPRGIYPENTDTHKKPYETHKTHTNKGFNCTKHTYKAKHETQDSDKHKHSDKPKQETWNEVPHKSKHLRFSFLACEY